MNPKNYITHTLDKLFKDECLYDKNNQKKSGPGIICLLFMFFIITDTIRNIKLNHSITELSDFAMYMEDLIDISSTLLVLTVTYHMCFICRGILGFFVVLTITSLIRYLRRSISP